MAIYSGFSHEKWGFSMIFHSYVSLPGSIWIYPLVMTNIAMVYRWPIEIDGLPNLKTGGSFHGELLVTTRW